MTMDLTIYDKNTATRTILVKQTTENARTALFDVLEQIPRDFDLSLPEGSPHHQMENMIDFLMEHFKTIAPQEIRKAIELNAAHKFQTHVETYGKFTQEKVGSILYNYRIWKHSQGQRGIISQEAEIQAINIQAELWRDWTRIRNNQALNVTQYVREKWDHLVQKARGFDGKISNNDLMKLEEIWRKKAKDPESSIHAFKKIPCALN